MATIKGTWTQVYQAQSLQRSSQTLSAIGSLALIFGGELRPREPRDNDVHIIDLVPTSRDQDAQEATLRSYVKTSDSPIARVGTASAVVDGKIYYFSGRGGVDMAPIDERGQLWRFDAGGTGWHAISPTNYSRPVPEPRSYHCMTSDGKNTLYLHAGCPTSGRLSDLWSFDVNERKWSQLTSAPGAPRGGTSITFSGGKLYRMGGFDGNHELGGEIDIYDIASNTWDTHTFKPDGKGGPGCRSVGSLLAVSVHGRPSLITAFGESDPSSLGHAGAGNMLPDAWVWDVENQKWSKIIGEEGGEVPQARGWYAADAMVVEGKECIIVQGGLAEDNQRLDDAWILNF
ncbi:kelch repeat protein [Aureobasidium namibiae CBS 147.97]|uniref:Kelch repeat protein n=1 Tax=Aureobasidium namibiae CBS 147.97 TaxID=1043004 RepID=A0A074WVU4_9PEZI|nr:kelch repeat protein [Aureobasidium namibiae CBS 147.97]KEQ77313.1 kelch repeat protein [Aureobasidium namibiae CBS 147.97]